MASPTELIRSGSYYGYQLTALQRVTDYNKCSNNPIRIVSLSAPFFKEQLPIRDALVQELKETGCVLIDATMLGRNFQVIDYEMYSEKPQYIKEVSDASLAIFM